MKSTYDLIGTFWDGRPADAVAQTVPYDPLMPEAGTPYCLFDINGKRRGSGSRCYSPFGMRRTGNGSGRPWPAAVKSQ